MTLCDVIHITGSEFISKTVTVKKKVTMVSFNGFPEDHSCCEKPVGLEEVSYKLSVTFAFVGLHMQYPNKVVLLIYLLLQKKL